MSAIVALGESARIEGYALAGVTVLPTDDVGAPAAWRNLPDGTGLVLLTAAAADSLRDELRGAGRVLWAILPS